MKRHYHKENHSFCKSHRYTQVFYLAKGFPKKAKLLQRHSFCAFCPKLYTIAEIVKKLSFLSKDLAFSRVKRPKPWAQEVKVTNTKISPTTDQ